MVAKFIFWLCVVVIVYHYFIFPILIFIISVFRAKPVEKEEITPAVSVIVAAYNEEAVIEKKIANTRSLSYPKEKLEIIVVSDGSNDQTPKIVEKYFPEGVKGIHSALRKGKSSALNRAVSMAKGEILFFTDANTTLDPDSLKNLVRNFKDPEVGGVSGKKMIKKTMSGRSVSDGDAKFWQLESFLKHRESLIGSIPVGDGEIFAIRREFFEAIDEEIINDDASITLDIIKKGHRVVYDNDAISLEKASLSIKDDYNVKARMVYGGYQIIKKYNNLLFPFKSFFAFQFFSHKTLRHLMWMFLFLLLASNIMLSGLGVGYSLFFIAQSVFYLLAFIGYQQYKNNYKLSLFYYPMYYCMVNIAAFRGFTYLFQNKSLPEIWKKAQR